MCSYLLLKKSVVLSYRLIKHDACTYGEVETSTLFCHWDGNILLFISLKDIMWYPCCFAAKKDVISVLKRCIKIGFVCFCRSEMSVVCDGVVGKKIIQTLPNMQIKLMPIVKSCAAHCFFVDIKSDWFDEVQSSPRIDAKPPYGACVIWNLRMNKYKMKQR